MSWLTKEENWNEQLLEGCAGRIEPCGASMRGLAQPSSYDVDFEGMGLGVKPATRQAVHAVLAAKSLSRWGEWATKRFLLNRQVSQRYWHHAQRIELRLTMHRIDKLLRELGYGN